MTSTQTRIASMALFALLLTTPVTAGEPEAADPWAPVRVLIGEWQGNGSGFGAESRVLHTYRFAIQDQFIHSTTVSRSQARDDGTPGEIHEDQGFFSYDSDRGKIVFRQFLSEGYVNTFVMEDPQPGSRALVFTTEHTEGAGGTAARLTYSFDGDDAYRLVLELAPLGKDFFACQTMNMERSTGE